MSDIWLLLFVQQKSVVHFLNQQCGSVKENVNKHKKINSLALQLDIAFLEMIERNWKWNGKEKESTHKYRN